MKVRCYTSWEKSEKISCLEEVNMRVLFLHQVIDKVSEVREELYLLESGEAVVVFEGKGKTHINLIEQRLNEQKQEVYEELKDLDNHYEEMLSDIEDLYNELYSHTYVLKELGTKIEEGSALKEFVAKGREC